MCIRDRSLITELSCTSIRGTVYATRPRSDVCHGDATLQYGLSRKLSGTAARISHQLFSTLPVLVPPENVMPLVERMLNVTSTPLNTRVSSPTSFVRLTRMVPVLKTFGFVL